MDAPEQHLDSFGFLQQFWPDLYDLARKAEQVAEIEPDLASIRLRGFTESMVIKIFTQLGLQYDSKSSHFERLVVLEKSDLLDLRLLSKFHAIRKLGNNAAHSRKVTQGQVDTLLDDAWSLASWFCRYMRPDIKWLTPPRQSPALDDGCNAQKDEAGSSDRQPTASGWQPNVLKFPEDRIQRIRDQVARAMAEVDPRVRAVRTKISLRDSFSETLSPDQEACIDALSKFLADPDKHIFLLKGYAGTGKTFLAKGITEYFSAQGREFHLAAPTGRASKVISEKTGRVARTIHNQIYDFNDLREYVVGDEKTGSETYKLFAPIRANRDRANAVYIVDESSLLSNEYSEDEFFLAGTGFLLDDLVEYVGSKHGVNDRKIIFIGDPAQLPPVGMSTSPALDSSMLQNKFSLQVSEYELKEVQRQKADSGVIRNVMPLRECLSSGVFGSLNFTFDDDVSRVGSGEFIPLYMEARRISGSGGPVVITRTNAEATGLNESIRSALFPGRDFVAPGDRLIVTANAYLAGTFLANGEFVYVVDVGSMVERRSVTLRWRDKTTGDVRVEDVALVFREMQLMISLLDGTKATVTVKILDDLLHRGGAGLRSEEQRALYVDFLKRHPGIERKHDRRDLLMALRGDPYFTALRVKFGYAVTCHKAQGGEWEHVFVFCPSVRDPRNQEYFRWLYTAMTRSRKKLYLINPPEVRIQVVGEDWNIPPANPITSADRSSESNQGFIGEGALSGLESFRLGVLARVRELLEGSGIELTDVAHHQYQEAYYLRRDSDAIRVNVSYNGKYKVTAVAIPPAGEFGNQVAERLRLLAGQQIGASEVPAGGGGSSVVQSPKRQFLADFHEKLMPILKGRDIRVAELAEHAWCQRYTFARGDDSVVVDVFYDGKNRFTKCMPIKFKGGYGDPSGTLLPEVLEVLTAQVIP